MVTLQVSQQVALSMTPPNQIPELGIRVIKARRDLISGRYKYKRTIHKDSLSTKAVQRTSRPLESIDDVESCDSFPLSMFCVSDRITNDLKGKH
jgi:phage terminase small subunit